MDDTVAGVRDAAADAIGTAMKVVGEKVMTPYIESLDKLKQDKVLLYRVLPFREWTNYLNA